MRLLNAKTLEFQEFQYDNVPDYLVTSHRWTSNEATYKDVLKKKNEESVGYRKISNFCKFALRLNKDWIWIDTCCINQNSSAEVSESINSMWVWYSGCCHCIAYLHDVPSHRAGEDAVNFRFRASEWFERGWTLQELLAPRCVIFVTQNWEILGRKSPPSHPCSVTPTLLNGVIAEVTGIPQDVLCGFESHRDAVAKDVKMAWAANRRTTKAEDAAYCLLGVFDVHMPLIYGEGERNARKRLEQEIFKRDQDQDELVDRNTEWQLTSDTSLRSDVPFSPQEDDQRVHADDLCPICKLLLLEPVTTICNHTICESCMPTDDSLNMTIVPLESEGEAAGDAAVTNFQGMHMCPVCEARAIDTLLAFPNAHLTQTLRTKYPLKYAERSSQVDESSENTQSLTVHIGNWHELVGPDAHHWTFFVKPSRTDIIKEVHILLHETFPEPHVICPRPPYTLHGQGWGYFTIQVRVVLKPGFSWVSGNAETGPDGASNASLRLEWTLDFASFGGRGAMGRCRVKVKRERRGVQSASAAVARVP